MKKEECFQLHEPTAALSCGDVLQDLQVSMINLYFHKECKLIAIFHSKSFPSVVKPSQGSLDQNMYNTHTYTTGIL